MADKGVAMVAQKAWNNPQYGESNIRRKQRFNARDDRRADELEAAGLAQRATGKALKEADGLRSAREGGSTLNPTRAAGSPAEESASSSAPGRPRRAKTSKRSAGPKRKAKR